MVVILGDLNDTPDSETLSHFLDTDLMEVTSHDSFDTGEFAGIGTFGLGNDNQKIDYIFLSPNLFGKITGAGLFRKGVWPGKEPVRWTVYDTLKKKIDVASDHHVIYVDLDLTI